MKKFFLTLTMSIAIALTPFAHTSWPVSDDGVLSSKANQTPSFRDPALQAVVKKTIMDIVEPIELNVSFVSVVVMETESGIVRSNLNLTRTDWGWKTDEDCNHYLEAGNRRAALYLALLESGASPNESFFTSGSFIDEKAGCIIKDMNWSRGGWGHITIDRAMNRSDVAIIEACETHFARSVGTLAYYLGKTGIDLGNSSPEKSHGDFCNTYERTAWDPVEILGYRDKITPMDMTMWMQGIANGGKWLEPRFCESDPQNTILAQTADKRNIDLLKTAMRDEVTDGLLKTVNSTRVPVYGITNITPEKRLATRCAMFSGFIPGYTITFNMIHGAHVSRRLTMLIAKGIIDWIAEHRVNLATEYTVIKKVRPLPSGVD